MNYETLEMLRQYVGLGPIDSVKLRKARSLAEKQGYLKESTGDIVAVDYSNADLLEYKLRLNALMRRAESSWKKYLSVEDDGIGLEEYALMQLKNSVTQSRPR